MKLLINIMLVLFMALPFNGFSQKKKNGFMDTTQVLLMRTLKNDVLENTRKVTCVYDKTGELISELSQNWENGWENDYLETTEYNSKGDSLCTLRKLWIRNTYSFESEYMIRTVWAYDPNGKQLLGSAQRFKDKKAKNYLKYKYDYDTNDRKVIQRVLIYNDIKWNNFERTNYLYDKNGFVKESIFQKWDPVNSTWFSVERKTFTNDEHGNVFFSVTQLINENEWVNQSRYSKDYDMTGKLLISIYETWNYTNDDPNARWIQQTKWAYAYHKNGSPKKTENFKFVNGEWVSDQIIDYTYSQTK